MNNVRKQKDEGFTIIEVVLVLAIAALIMLMVFIALPALQRNQRDTTRKNDISRLQSALNNYKSRSRGALPGTTSSAYNTFFASDLRRNNDQFADPSGGNYVPVVAPNGATPPAAGTGVMAYSEAEADKIYIYPGATCTTDAAQGTVNTAARKAAIVKPLEGGGAHCAEA